MATVATFSSDSKMSLGLQYELLWSFNASGTNELKFSLPKQEGGKFTFTLTSELPNNKNISKEVLDKYLVAGVSYSLSDKKDVTEHDQFIENVIMSMASGNTADVDLMVEKYLELGE